MRLRRRRQPRDLEPELRPIRRWHVEIVMSVPVLHPSERAAEIWSAWTPEDAHKLGLGTSLDTARNAVKVTFLVAASTRDAAIRFAERQLRNRGFLAHFYECSANESPLSLTNRAAAPG